ncbi:hypothetical protein OU995_23270 [Roseateles sp. SL47]|uniref:hypothetical protein n=1 Tax=Roseateles sp. SL47 TaxID=2995138 RepID=UPI002271AD6D|nr:hypothetical protein [Roseateles sp. SL47]WAC72442.1 hypothetical protein OU995_23270 [Roseateles sp. SL47]
MLWAGKRAVATVYLGQEEIRLAHRDTQQLVASGLPMVQALPLLQEALQSLGRVGLRVLLSAGWCQPFLLPPIEGVKGESEWRQVAEGLVEELTGMPVNSRLWLDHQNGLGPLVVALHPDIEEALKPLWEKHRLASLRPWWAEVLDGHVKAANAASTAVSATPSQGHGVAVVDSDSVTLLLEEGERYVAAQSYALLGEPAQPVLARALVSHGRHLGEVSVLEMNDVSSRPTASAPEWTPFLEGAA